jgi:hypothetical protein
LTTGTALNSVMITTLVQKVVRLHQSTSAINKYFLDYCPGTCVVCCKDSVGKLLYEKELRGYDQLQDQCEDSNFDVFRPSSCGKY